MSLFKGQLDQDKWVCDMFGYKSGGYFLDIGAFDGVQISNTYYLEKNLGWDGICVEAGKNNFEELIKNRSCTCLNVAVTDHNAFVNFAENWTYGKIGEGIRTECISIDRLLIDWKVPKAIDYISLDVEGSEYDILKLFPFDDYQVNLWTIEHNAHEDGGIMRDNIRHLMLSNGYSIYKEQPFEDWWHDNK